MVPKTSKIRCLRAFSLVDIMISIVVLLVALLGTSNFRYYSALEAQKAAAKITAARIGLMFCENWRGIGGIETYDPATSLGSALTITTSTSPEKPEDFTLLESYTKYFTLVGSYTKDFTLLGSYTVTVNGTKYYMTLSWKDVSTGLRALNVIVAWAQRPQGQISIKDVDKSFKLTTYAL